MSPSTCSCHIPSKPSASTEPSDTSHFNFRHAPVHEPSCDPHAAENQHSALAATRSPVVSSPWPDPAATPAVGVHRRDSGYESQSPGEAPTPVNHKSKRLPPPLRSGSAPPAGRPSRRPCLSSRLIRPTRSSTYGQTYMPARPTSQPAPNGGVRTTTSSHFNSPVRLEESAAVKCYAGAARPGQLSAQTILAVSGLTTNLAIASAEAVSPEPAHPPPPPTTHYWTSDRTRRLEYAAIDAASRGVRGWVMRNFECFVPRKRRHVNFDDDKGSVRRYRIELAASEDDEEDGSEHYDEKTRYSRRTRRSRGAWAFLTKRG